MRKNERAVGFSGKKPAPEGVGYCPYDSAMHAHAKDEGSRKAEQRCMLPAHTQTGRAWKGFFHARPVVLWHYE